MFACRFRDADHALHSERLAAAEGNGLEQAVGNQKESVPWLQLQWLFAVARVCEHSEGRARREAQFEHPLISQEQSGRVTGVYSAYHAGGVFDPQEERGDEVLVAELLAESGGATTAGVNASVCGPSDLGIPRQGRDEY
jgi:hypothetical protein